MRDASVSLRQRWGEGLLGDFELRAPRDRLAASFGRSFVRCISAGRLSIGQAMVLLAGELRVSTKRPAHPPTPRCVSDYYEASDGAIHTYIHRMLGGDGDQPTHRWLGRQAVSPWGEADSGTNEFLCSYRDAGRGIWMASGLCYGFVRCSRILPPTDADVAATMRYEKNV